MNRVTKHLQFIHKKSTNYYYNNKPGNGCGSVICWEPEFKPQEFKTKGDPIPVLYHEFVHSYNNATGTMQNGETFFINKKGQKYYLLNSELQAVGLKNPFAQLITYPDGVKRSTNPPEFTENAMRKRRGIPLRDCYYDNEFNSHPIQPYTLLPTK